jgi:hypothetical protein
MDPTVTPSLDTLRTDTGAWPEEMLVALGQALHDGRTAELVEGVEDHAPYDDAHRISYAPVDFVALGVRVRADPRRVGVTEVARYAKSGCRTCYGRGYLRIKRRMSVGPAALGAQRLRDFEYDATCGCADKRYKARNKRVVIDSQLGEWIALENLTVEPEA